MFNIQPLWTTEVYINWMNHNLTCFFRRQEYQSHLSKKRKVINQVSTLKAKWIAGLDFFSWLEQAHFFQKKINVLSFI